MKSSFKIFSLIVILAMLLAGCGTAATQAPAPAQRSHPHLPQRSHLHRPQRSHLHRPQRKRQPQRKHRLRIIPK